MKTRLQKYPVSYMIYSPSFRALPPQVKDLVMGRINRVLAGEEGGPKYAHLTPPIRQAVQASLKSTM